MVKRLIVFCVGAQTSERLLVFAIEPFSNILFSTALTHPCASRGVMDTIIAIRVMNSRNGMGKPDVVSALTAFELFKSRINQGCVEVGIVGAMDPAVKPGEGWVGFCVGAQTSERLFYRPRVWAPTSGGLLW